MAKLGKGGVGAAGVVVDMKPRGNWGPNSCGRQSKGWSEGWRGGGMAGQRDWVACTVPAQPTKKALVLVFVHHLVFARGGLLTHADPCESMLAVTSQPAKKAVVLVFVRGELQLTVPALLRVLEPVLLRLLEIGLKPQYIKGGLQILDSRRVFAPSTCRCWVAKHISTHEFGAVLKKGAMLSFVIHWPQTRSRPLSASCAATACRP